MLHCEQHDLMTKQVNHCVLPFGWTQLPIKNLRSLLLRCALNSFSHRFLQRYEPGPPPRQRYSVAGVVEVGALYTEAARSSHCKIAGCQEFSIR
jgi:hypothetical protein